MKSLEPIKAKKAKVRKKLLTDI